MSHEIEIKNGVASFAAYGETAWHGLGKYFTERMTAEKAIIESGMDFTVVLQKIRTSTGIIIPDRFATVRTDLKKVLGVVGDRYEIIQNKDVFGFFDPIIDKEEAIYETAGVLFDGKKIFLTAKLPSDISVRGDKIDQYILLTSSHDGSGPIIAGFTPIRVVCNNTLTAALPGLKNRVTIRHTANAKTRIADAHRVMGLCSTYMEGLKLEFDKMAKAKITDKKLKDFVLSVLIPKKETLTKEELEKGYSSRAVNLCDEIVHFAKTHETQTTDASKGTVFGAYNAISGYFNYTKEYESADDRMQDFMFNGMSNRISLAFDLCRGMVN